ncbi:hypothetical protein [Rurimicrobium arvi]|uniref:Uncharacterized protein n=1 Tax=Rurimicrobium arvi TaxID=2049916 RepID=A0ABP8MYX6_9BACT
MAQSDFPELRSLFDKNREVVRMLKGEKQLSDKQIYFTAIYSKLGKKIAESRDRTSLTAFTTVMCGRYQVCQPDSITVTWHNADTAEKLFEHTFNISRMQREAEVRQQSEPLTQPQPTGSFQGLGEVEVNNLVEKRLTELRQKEEYERLREENQKMQIQIAELESRNADLAHDIAAKETTESYLKIVGMALPGIAKFFGGASLLSMLAGVDEQPGQQAQSLGTAPQPAQPSASDQQQPRDEREQMIFMLRDYMSEELSQQEVATLYLMFMEIQKDKTLIQKILNHITQQQQ